MVFAREQQVMPNKATATVQVDEKGRVTIPAPTRKALDIHEMSADLDLYIEVLERHGEVEADA